MTLDLGAALPEDLAQRVEAGAEGRGVATVDFLILLVGLSLLPQMRLSEDCAVRDLSDEVMAYFQRRAADIERESGKTVKWIPGVNDYQVPQSLEEIGPRVPPPPGMTAMQFIRGQWPGDETEEELLATLKAMG